MSGVGNKVRRLRYKLRHGVSVENVVLLVAVVMCLVWTYQSVAAMSRSWELTERLATEKRNLELLHLEVEMMELENEYYKSDEYQELMARKNAGKQLAGEHMVYLPENSELAKSKHAKVEIAEMGQKEYSNFEKWMRFLFPN